MPPRLRYSLLNRHVCIACQLRSGSKIQKYATIDVKAPRSRLLSSTSTLRSKSSESPFYYPPSEGLTGQPYAQLTNRSVIRLQGPDVVSFLNGLLPSRLQPLPTDSSTPIFTAFLSAKGRLLYDVFIFPPLESDADGPWHIDVETASASALYSHLKKHKLRSKFKLEKIPQDDIGVYYIWPGHEENGVSTPVLGGQDPRPLMGVRFLSTTAAPSPTLEALKSSGASLSVEDYMIHRMLTGHAEGPTELFANSALPQESNIDFSQGIDFHKGCYLGQELTIRTHHTGVVRKRILPCQISMGFVSADQKVPVYDSSVSVPVPPNESNISKMRATGRTGRSTGKWLSGVGNIGLALCRLEMMTDIQLTAEGTKYDPSDRFAVNWDAETIDVDGKPTSNEVVIQPFVPVWLRQSIEAGIQARVERTKRRRQEDDEDEDEAVQ